MKAINPGLGLGLLLAGCATPAPAPPERFSWAEIEPILAPVVYRDVLGKKCGVPSARVKVRFLAELKSAGASQTLLAQSQSEAARIESAERKRLNEYVCTAEVFDSTEANASRAFKAWTILKGRGA